MRDLKIHAQNFLSHEDTEIKLDGIDAVIVTGKNGSGKSTLLVDCPLVALFGRGRAESIGDYIRNGKDMMIVEYDFSILNDQRYRVTRKHSRKTARGSSSLQFKRIDATGNETMDLTAGSIDETQEIIEKTIGTDLDTLMHTSIYEQEEADFFCKARPSERMKLFSKVWDLEKYSRYAQAARDIWLGKKDKPGLQAEIAAIDARITSAKQRISEIKGKEGELEKLRSDIEKEIQGVSSLEKKRGDLQKKLGAFEKINENLKKSIDDKARVEQEIKNVSGQHSQLLSKIERFTKIFNNQEVVRAKVIEEEEKTKALSDLETELKSLDQTIETLRQEMEVTRKEYQGRLDEIEIETHAIDVDLSDARKKETTLQKAMGEIGRSEEQLKHLCLDADKLKGIACHPDFDPNFINETCRFIRDAIEAKRRIPEFKFEIAAKRMEIESSMASLKGQIGLFEEKRAWGISLIMEIKKNLSGAISAKEADEKTMISGRNGKKIEIEGIKTELQEIKRYTKLLPEIDLAEKELPSLKKEGADLSKRCNELVATRNQIVKEIGELNENLSAKGKLDTELQLVAINLNQAITRKDELTKKIGFIEAELAQGETLKTQIEQDEKQIERLESDKALYQILEDAFKQIPYMLVARGIDVVERIANEILGMISSVGLTVQIKTEKETKTTKTVKDEIYLSFEDNEGHKEYKLLSQGEKVRAAVALRLAMSEAQAHRRGVRIDKLIADDVFGALDTEGIEDMKIAMRELKKRFKFTAILSHIESVQDIFPTRLIFSKGPGGSRIEVQEDYA